MGQAQDYDALIRELLAGVAGGWDYVKVTFWLWNVDEEDLTLWLRKFAEGLSLERDWELIEQLKLLGGENDSREVSIRGTDGCCKA